MISRSVHRPASLATLATIVLAAAALTTGCSSTGSSTDPAPGSSTTAKKSAETTAQASPETALCDVSAAGWEACKDKDVRIEGQNPARGVRQHPMMVGMSIDGSTPEHQSYMDVGDRQLVLISKDKIACEGAMVATGTLEYFELGGEPGTKGSYANWVVRNAKVACK